MGDARRWVRLVSLAVATAVAVACGAESDPSPASDMVETVDAADSAGGDDAVAADDDDEGAGDTEEEGSAEIGAEQPGQDAAAPDGAVAGLAGEAQVVFAGDTFSFVLVDCLVDGTPQGGLIDAEFGGWGVDPSVPSAAVEEMVEAMEAYLSGPSPETEERFARASAELLAYGPTFDYRRRIDGGDRVVLTFDDGSRWINPGAPTLFDAGSDRFMEQAGATVSGSSEVVADADGPTEMLSVEAVCF